MHGGFNVQNNNSSFPLNPRSGQFALVDGVLYIYSTIRTISTWYPLTNRRNGYVHLQGVEAMSWNVQHGFGSKDIIYIVYDENDAVQQVGADFVSDDTIRVNFSEPTKGKCVAFCAEDNFAQQVSTSMLTVGSVYMTGESIMVSGEDIVPIIRNLGDAAFKNVGITADDVAAGAHTHAPADVQTTASDRFVTDTQIASWSSKQDAITETTDLILNNLSVVTSIVPTTPSTVTLGSATNPFQAAYIDELHVAQNTLYIGDTPVLGTESDNIIVKADPDQSISVRTTGIGNTSVISEHGVEISTNGMNGYATIQSTGVGGQVNLGAVQAVNVNAPLLDINGDVDVSGDAVFNTATFHGNVTFEGTTTTVNSETVTTTDNIIVLNDGEVGDGVTAGISGIQIDRGGLAAERFVYDETADAWKFGKNGSELDTVPGLSYVTSELDKKWGIENDPDYTNITSNYTVSQNREKLIVAEGVVITLPATPIVGYTVRFAVGGDWVNNPIIIFNNGSKIEGVLESMTCDMNQPFGVTYQGTERGWVIIN